jgi:hypothetical protein
MPRGRQAPPPVRFRGTPGRLSGVLSIAQDDSRSDSLGLEDAEWPEVAGGVVSIGRREASGQALVHLSVPESTPPGQYRATVRVGERTYPVICEVEPRVKLRLYPSKLVLVSQPGAMATVELTLVNLGNVPCEVRRAHGLGLFARGGLEQAIGAMVTAKLASGLARVERLVEQVAEAHAGLVRLRVEEGAGTIAPGESRQLRVGMHMPENLRPGTTYTGTWALHNLRYLVEVTAAQKPRSRKETA